MKRSLLLIPALGTLLVGCENPRDLASPERLDLLAGTASIGGNVVNADSLPVAGARVVVYRVGSLPPDTTPPDTTPPDTLPPDTTGVTGVAGDFPITLLWIDSVPGDTTPPPPPPAECVTRGRPVGRARTDQGGAFLIRGLDSGIYDVRASGPRDTRGKICGAILREGQQTFVTIILN